MKKISGCSGRPPVGGEIWGPDLLPLKSDLAAEWVKKSNERSGAVRGVQKIKWSVSGAGGRSGNAAVSGTPVNGAER